MCIGGVLVLSDLCSVVTPRIRSSSAGEFTEESVETGSVAVGLIASDDIRFAGSDCPGHESGSGACGEDCCKQVSS